MKGKRSKESAGPSRSATELRFVDLCAGLGGFHLALTRAARGPCPESVARTNRRWTFRCVMAADIKADLRKNYVQNFPELEETYREFFPTELCAKTTGLNDLYDERGSLRRIHGDLAHLVDLENNRLRCFGGTDKPIVPEHDLLCAGFPCQPFSKSGAQLGFEDLNGTVFRMLAIIITERQPKFVFLENVGNFERHDKGNTWKVVREWLRSAGYSVRATTTVGGEDGGQGLLSPHHLGLPQHRERFYIVAQHEEQAGTFHEDRYPFPLSYRSHPEPESERLRLEARSESALRSILLDTARSLPKSALAAAKVSDERTKCVDHWRLLLEKIVQHDTHCPEADRIRPLPSFPIWGYELDPWNQYPAHENPGPLASRPRALMAYRRRHLETVEAQWGRDFAPTGERAYLGAHNQTFQSMASWVASWPGYARDRDAWPGWKRRFIEQNREWASTLWSKLDRAWLRGWLDELSTLTASHQKLEWNCQGEDVDLWKHILQFRPSGLRVKRFRHIPALVALTTTQIPILPAPGADGVVRPRHLLEREALQLQGFPTEWHTPPTKGRVFAALGNAVHVDLVAAVARAWLFEDGGRYTATGETIAGQAPSAPQEGSTASDRRDRPRHTPVPFVAESRPPAAVESA